MLPVVLSSFLAFRKAIELDGRTVDDGDKEIVEVLSDHQ
jgi:hypothetical protein